ncbi:hypothetical protein IEQ34_005169 [Dendrobium chrysotoxum]|uniref:Rx N-terminal domain-containing protein n=1 Tax=Dendrobium chrysotoxum TaxID=161865 RepID=A0AAV7H8Y9_DENCH|nr:hypothetical protein IEQ34_005169 [Dendrobium chrysotoxum]
MKGASREVTILFSLRFFDCSPLKKLLRFFAFFYDVVPRKSLGLDHPGFFTFSLFFHCLLFFLSFRQKRIRVFSCLIVLLYLDGWGARMVWWLNHGEAHSRAGKAAKTPPPLIQFVVFASNEAHIRDQNPSLSKWLWLLRGVIDEADDVLKEFEYKQLQKQLNIKERLIKFADYTLKKLEVVVKKLDEVSVDVGKFLHLTENSMLEK